MNARKWMGLLALAVFLPVQVWALPFRGDNVFTGKNTFSRPVILERGLNIGSTGYGISSAGVATFAGGSGTTGNYSGVVTAAGFTIGSAAIVEAELEQLDTVTAGTRAANKAVVLGPTSSIDAWTVLGNLIVHGTSTLNGNVTTTGTATAAGFTIGSAAIVEAELEQIDSVTAGTGAASKAVVLGATAAIDSWRVLGGATVDGAVTAGSVTTTGTATVAGLTIGSAAIVEAELEQGDSVTAGALTALKNVVVGATKAVDEWTVLGALKVHGASTLNGDVTSTGTLTGATVTATGTVNGVAGTFTGALTGLRSVITVTTDTALTAAQCRGTMIYISVADSDSTVTLTVPTLVAGYDFIVCDNDVTAGAGVEVQMSAGDKVNGGTAAKKYKHGNAETAVGTAHFVSVDATDLILVGTPTDSGNWANDNS